ncbi:MAG: RNA-binding S4 domain-containing protein [Sphingomonadales bacterium]|nr:RNA-binding S4 domain-containing protein [Sphingomonadales bacterium]
MRIDKLLWFLRLAGSRSFAQAWVLDGHIRLNGRRIEKPSAAVGCGDVLTLPMRGEVRIVEVLTLPTRRGPASEAQACYRVLDASAGNPIAAGKDNSP